MLTSQAEVLLPHSNLVDGRTEIAKEETLQQIYKDWGLSLDTITQLLLQYLYVLSFIHKCSLGILHQC